MDNKNMDTDKKYLIAAFAVLIAALGVMVVGILNHLITSKVGTIILAAGIFLFWLIMDVVEPIATHKVQDLEPIRKDAFIKYAALDLVGYAGISYFLMTMGSNSTYGLIGAIAYAAVMSPKRNFHKIYMGIVDPEEADEDEEEAADAIITQEESVSELPVNETAEAVQMESVSDETAQEEQEN